MTMTRKAISAAISTNGIESRTRVMTAFISPHGGLQRCVSSTGAEADRPALMPTPARGRAGGVVGVGACGTVSRPIRAAQSVRSVCELPNGVKHGPAKPALWCEGLAIARRELLFGARRRARAGGGRALLVM